MEAIASSTFAEIEVPLLNSWLIRIVSTFLSRKILVNFVILTAKENDFSLMMLFFILTRYFQWSMSNWLKIASLLIFPLIGQKSKGDTFWNFFMDLGIITIDSFHYRLICFFRLVDLNKKAGLSQPGHLIKKDFFILLPALPGSSGTDRRNRSDLQRKARTWCQELQPADVHKHNDLDI